MARKKEAAPVVAWGEYPKQLDHPMSDGKALMPVIVDNEDQEQEYYAKGYRAAGGDPQAFLTAKLTERLDDTYRRLDKHVIESLDKAFDKLSALVTKELDARDKIHRAEMESLEKRLREFVADQVADEDAQDPFEVMAARDKALLEARLHLVPPPPNGVSGEGHPGEAADLRVKGGDWEGSEEMDKERRLREFLNSLPDSPARVQIEAAYRNSRNFEMARAEDEAAGLVPLTLKIADDYADIRKRMESIKHDFIGALRAPYVPPV